MATARARTTSARVQRRGGDLQRLSLREQAYECIKKDIITCKLRPGEIISEASLSERLKIGRTPVHQALDRLMTDGLVEVMPRKGVIVRPLSLDEAFAIVEMRLLTEGYCAGVAAERIEQKLIDQLEDNLARMQIAIGKRRPEEILELDSEFHGLVASAGGNFVMKEILANLHDRATRFWFISLRSGEQQNRVLVQHTEIVRAIASHDAEAAKAAMRRHIEQFISNLTSMM